MPFFAETQEQIYGEILNELINNTNITRSSPGSKTRALIEAVSRKMGRMYSVFDLNFGQAFVQGAEGEWLSFIGEMLNVPRLGETAAVVTALDKNIKFIAVTGTFGDINSGSSISLPAGTIISTEAGGGGIRYRTVINTILSASSSEAYVSVEATRPGTLQNVGKGQLRYHDFIGYADSDNNTLQVTNEADVVTGTDLESETNYRFRIANQVTAAEAANEISVRLAALSVPGVAEITSVPYHRGIGTFDLLVKSTTPTASAGLISTVQASVSEVAANGIFPRVRAPSELGLSLVGTLQYRRRLSSEEEQEIIDAVTQNVTDSINSLDIGEEMIVQELLEVTLSTSDLIKKVGSTSKPFDNLFLYRPSRLEDNKVRSTIIDDYNPESDERIIVENKFAGATPILFRSA